VLDVTKPTDKRSLSGQSAVEYLLLLVVIATTVWLFNNLLSPKVADGLRVAKEEYIEKRAMRGNPQPVVPSPSIQNYYVNQNKRVEVK